MREILEAVQRMIIFVVIMTCVVILWPLIAGIYLTEKIDDSAFYLSGLVFSSFLQLAWGVLLVKLIGMLLL